MKSLVPLSTISLFIYLFYAYLVPANHTWLHGEWVNQDANTMSRMIFDKDGTVEVLGDQGTVTCIYGYLAAKVSMQCEILGTKKELRYSVSADKKTLSNAKRNTLYQKGGIKLTAYYVKSDTVGS